jgi:hypothetical protein
MITVIGVVVPFFILLGFVSFGVGFGVFLFEVRDCGFAL